jgi:hypothetical protein
MLVVAARAKSTVTCRSSWDRQNLRAFGTDLTGMLAPFEEKRLSEAETTIADLERRIADQDARIIVTLLKGLDTHEAEEKVETDRIILASMKTSLRAFRSKNIDDMATVA